MITPEHIERLRRDINAADLEDANTTVEMTLKGTRTGEDGVPRSITVEICREDGKWFLRATNDDVDASTYRAPVTGNPESTLDAALAMVQDRWRQLDT
ncbi:MAG: hypothetical protein LC808_29470 [Actinobacteria bacterium]|nr:hypothetical protein [Actinomycetota bacterium]